MVSNLLRMSFTLAWGPKFLTTSAGGPLKDLEIQFLIVVSGNLAWASLTSWIHWAKVASFFPGGVDPLKVGILRASPWGLTANADLPSSQRTLHPVQLVKGLFLVLQLVLLPVLLPLLKPSYKSAALSVLANAAKLTC